MPRGDNRNECIGKALTTEEARRRGKLGGIASGEARRKRKSLKETLLLMLEDEQLQSDIALALLKEAKFGNNAGSVTKAFEVIRDTIGEKPVERVEQTNIEINVEFEDDEN